MNAPRIEAKRRRWPRTVALTSAGVVLVAATAFLVWALTPLGPGPDAVAALSSAEGVRVTETDFGWLFIAEDAATPPETGLVFYPGGRVDARSYAPFAAGLARAGHAVALVKMPLSLAVFDANAARDVFGSPLVVDVKRWAVGGHSLGGAMAAAYASDEPDRVDGLLLLAAYTTANADLRESDLAVTDVTGSLDAVLDRGNWQAGSALLPADAVHVSIAGGNHAQFGDYGPQPGDAEATIAPEVQLRQAVDAADALLDRL